jgi:uncharacterized protein (DUF983 family)
MEPRRSLDYSIPDRHLTPHGPAMPTIRWLPDRAQPLPPWPVPPLGTALSRGITARCPACGKARLFSGYLRVVPTCPSCQAPLGTASADDAPPYFVVLISAHIIIPLILLTQKLANPSSLMLSAIFVPLTLLLAIGLLRPVKGGVLGVLVAMRLLGEKPRPE